jgi:heme A synthase
LQLGLAFTLFSALLWSGLDLVTKAPAQVAPDVIAKVSRLRPVALAAAAIVGITVASGAFVAGNGAGFAYNDWPLFAGRVIPELIWDDKVMSCVRACVCVWPTVRRTRLTLWTLSSCPTAWCLELL